MDKSSKMGQVKLGLLALVAVSAMGCSQNRYDRVLRRCVDDKGNVLPDTACTMPGGYMHGGTRIFPTWAYGGTGGITPGTRAMGFTRTAPANGADIVNSRGNVVRKGFGGTSGTRSGGFLGG